MTAYPSVGTIHRFDPAFDELVGPDARLEQLSDGFTWTEGPIWVRDGGYLLFSDIPRNSIFRWKEGEGVSLYLSPSGYTGRTYYGLEPGSNGLTLDSQGRLTACEHGDRRVSRLYADGGKMTLADRYQGKRLNSPNDLVFRSNGDLYFTDPAYGIPDRYEDTTRRELDFCGVYRLTPDGRVDLMTDELIKPNGLAFSPDESVLFVSQSDPDRAIWMRYEVKADGSLAQGEVFQDVTEHAGQLPGLPDGFKIDEKGNLFATGPGGVWVFSAEGKPLGRIETGQRTANCAWGDDGSTLYIAAHMLILRIRTRTRAAVMPGRP